MSKTYFLKKSDIASLDVALLCKRGLEAAGYDVVLVGYLYTNKISGSFEWELDDHQRYIEREEDAEK